MGSLNARGTWPDPASYPVDEKAEQAGIASVGILDAVRKLKAEKGVSIKWPLKNISLTTGKENGDFSVIEACIDDLKNVTNASNIQWTDSTSDAVATEDGLYKVAAEFAEESDAA